jgi:hypothetical protein
VALGAVVSVADAAGNTTASATVASRRVDNTGPTASLADPGSPLRATITLSATASDPSGVASVAIQRRAGSGGAWTAVCTATTTPYWCSLNATALTDRADDFQAVATDAAGNGSTGSVTNRVVDDTAPQPTDVTTVNGGAAGKMDAEDLLRFSFSEAVQPSSVLSGWSGSDARRAAVGHRRRVERVHPVVAGRRRLRARPATSRRSDPVRPAA